MLAEYFAKVKQAVSENKSNLILSASFFLVAIIAFGLGRLSVLVEDKRKTPVIVQYQDADNPGAHELLAGAGLKEEVAPKGEAGIMGAALYVGSKNSNKYHLPDCPGALRIKEENKIWFSSEKEAKDLGYAPASNCDGL